MVEIQDGQGRILISIVSPDEVGLVAAITGALFDMGLNLEDASFAVLGGGCEFSCVACLGADLGLEEVEQALDALEPLESAEIKVSSLPFSPAHEETAEITHVVEVEGGDMPGLIARMSEVFSDYGANVVRMNSRLRKGEGGLNRYLTVFAVYMPEGRAETCLAAAYNTAGQLNLDFRSRPV